MAFKGFNDGLKINYVSLFDLIYKKQKKLWQHSCKELEKGAKYILSVFNFVFTYLEPENFDHKNQNKKNFKTLSLNDLNRGKYLTKTNL